MFMRTGIVCFEREREVRKRGVGLLCHLLVMSAQCAAYRVSHISRNCTFMLVQGKMLNIIVPYGVGYKSVRLTNAFCFRDFCVPESIHQNHERPNDD